MEQRSVRKLVLGYVVLRLLLTVALGAAIWAIAALAGLAMPAHVAALLALIVQLPLAWLVLGRMRRRVMAGVAESAGERRRLRQELREALAAPVDAEPRSRPDEHEPVRQPVDAGESPSDIAGDRR